jgi:tetratricopeptide (TPR) repeat protein
VNKVTAVLDSSLDTPDDLRSRGEPGHSDTVAAILMIAYGCLKLRLHRKACACVTQCLARPMSYRQRMRVFYVLAMSAVGERDLLAAAIFLDEALGLALRLDDLGACAELAYLHSSISSERQEFAVAADYGDISLEALHMIGDGANRPVDAAFELEVVVGLSIHNFLRGQYQNSMSCVEEARRLIPLAPKRPLQAAAIEWMAALLDRWRGDLSGALHHAMAASEVYAGSGGLALNARIQSVVADIALDLARSFATDGPHHARDAFIELAGPYAKRAVQLAAKAQSASDQGLSLLTRARYRRTRGGNAEGIPTIEAVAHMANQLGDVPLLGQAHTALGDELAARGEAEAALNCYRTALDVLARSDASAMAVWPRRALLRASEMR